MFQTAWSKPLKVHRGLGNSYIQIHPLMKFWQSSSAQSLDNNHMTSSVLGNLATDWAKGRKAQGQKQLLRCHQPLLVLWPLFCSNGFCTGWLTKKTWQSESHSDSAINATEVPEVHRCGEGQQVRVFIFGSFHHQWVLCQRVEAFVLTQLPVTIQVHPLCPAQRDRHMNHESH